MKSSTLLQAILKGEEETRCFICCKFLRPMLFSNWLKKFLLFWMDEQYVVGLIRPLDKTNEGGESLVSLLEITTCLKCANWAQEHPLEAEMLSTARLASITKHGDQ